MNMNRPVSRLIAIFFCSAFLACAGPGGGAEETSEEAVDTGLQPSRPSTK